MKVKSGSRSTDWQSRIGWICLVAIFVAVLALGANRPLNWIIFCIVISLAFAAQIFLLDRNLQSKHTARLAGAGVLFAGVLVWAILQTLPGIWPQYNHPAWQAVSAAGSISADPGRGWHMILRLSAYAMIVWLGFRACADRRRAVTYLKAIANFAILVSLFGILATLTKWNPIVNQGSFSVVSASFINRNAFATFAIIGLIANVAIYFRYSDQSGRQRSLREAIEAFFSRSWLPLTGCICLFGALLLSQSRAGAVSAFVACVVFWIAYRNDGVRGTVNGIVTVMAFAAIVAVSASQGVLERLVMTSGDDLRFVIYPYIVQGIMERPLFGHGLGAFHDTFRAFVPQHAAYGEWDMAHSSYLENAYELGIPAALLLYLSILLLVLTLWRGLQKRRRDREIGAAAIAIIAGTGTHALVDFSLQMPANAALFAFFIGMGLAQTARSKPKWQKAVQNGPRPEENA